MQLNTESAFTLYPLAIWSTTPNLHVLWIKSMLKWFTTNLWIFGVTKLHPRAPYADGLRKWSLEKREFFWKTVIRFNGLSSCPLNRDNDQIVHIHGMISDDPLISLWVMSDLTDFRVKPSAQFYTTICAWQKLAAFTCAAPSVRQIRLSVFSLPEEFVASSASFHLTTSFDHFWENGWLRMINSLQPYRWRGLFINPLTPPILIRQVVF